MPSKSFAELANAAKKEETKTEEVKSETAITETEKEAPRKPKRNKKNGTIVIQDIIGKNESVDRTNNSVYLFTEQKEFLANISEIYKIPLIDIMNNLVDYLKENLDKEQLELIENVIKMKNSLSK